MSQWQNCSGSATWLLTQIDADGDTLFGPCDLGLGFPELGSVSLAELASVKGRLGLGIERDLWLKARFPLSFAPKQRAAPATSPKPSGSATAEALGNPIPSFRRTRRSKSADKASLPDITCPRQPVRFDAKIVAKGALPLYPPNHDSPRSRDRQHRRAAGRAGRAGLGARR
ncbi:DUF2958 domain-containing protein [Mesorhizobium norvegicum]|uniref:DUF2958 domain-containing protein n=1 Tax=Mesorhizobium norvegicum TaxID=1085774 RepID=UPI003CCC5695